MIKSGIKKSQSASERKKAERTSWKEAGGVFKEIKFTKEGLEKLQSIKTNKGLQKDWEVIDYLLQNGCD